MMQFNWKLRYFHWRHRHHKLGDTIMMLSAMEDYGRPWPIIDKEIGPFWDDLVEIYGVSPKVFLSGGLKFTYHKTRLFPILKPLIDFSKGDYVVTHTMGAKEWTSVDKIPEDLLEGNRAVCIDGLRLPMKELFTIIGNAKFFVGIDSGPMWIAESCRVRKKILLTPSQCKDQRFNHKLLTDVEFY